MRSSVIDFSSEQNALRKSILEQLKKVTPAERSRSSSDLARKFSEEFQAIPDHALVAFFHPMPQEIDVLKLLPFFQKKKCPLFFPRVKGDALEWVPVSDLSTPFASGKFGILEPVGKSVESVFDWILVPGLVFDQTGARIGRGKGFYDRFLATQGHAFKIGIGFDFQLSDDPILQKPIDIKMDFVITNARFFHTSHNPRSPHTR